MACRMLIDWLAASVRAELESVRRENAHLLSLTNQRAAAATSDDDERDRKLAILHDQNSTNPTKFLYPSCRGGGNK